MPIYRSADNKLSPRERLYKLLGRMIDPDLSDAAKRQCCEEFTYYTEGNSITQDWGKEWGLPVRHGIDRGMGYIDIFLPRDKIPAWYELRYKKAHPGEPVPQPHVRFYLTMRESEGSKTPGIGPIIDQ